MITLATPLNLMQPTDIDQIWLPRMQAVEHALQTVRFYEEQLDSGGVVSLHSLERAKQNLQQAQDNEQAFQQEFRLRGNWTRVWMGSDGQLHRNLDCAGKNPQLLPFLSGVSLNEIIQRATTTLCLECFPQAKQHPAWMSARKAEKALNNCPGSSRKTDQGSCVVCSQAVELTAKGRAKAHSNQPSS